MDMYTKKNGEIRWEEITQWGRKGNTIEERNKKVVKFQQILKVCIDTNKSQNICKYHGKKCYKHTNLYLSLEL